MSKRGSLNAIRFAGKRWSLKPKKTSGINKEESKKNSEFIRKENKEKRIESQFESLCKKFNISNETIASGKYEYQKTSFCRIKKSKIRIQALQNVKSFKLFCKKYDEIFSIEIYFEKEYYFVDFRKEYPDVYFFNVYSPKDK